MVGIHGIVQYTIGRAGVGRMWRFDWRNTGIQELRNLLLAMSLSHLTCLRRSSVEIVMLSVELKGFMIGSRMVDLREEIVRTSLGWVGMRGINPYRCCLGV
jgi:hypothetical protein